MKALHITGLVLVFCTSIAIAGISWVSGFLVIVAAIMGNCPWWYFLAVWLCGTTPAAAVSIGSWVFLKELGQ
jgi:hypothetical protein